MPTWDDDDADSKPAMSRGHLDVEEADMSPNKVKVARPPAAIRVRPSRLPSKVDDVASSRSADGAGTRRGGRDGQMSPRGGLSPRESFSDSDSRLSRQKSRNEPSPSYSPRRSPSSGRRGFDYDGREEEVAYRPSSARRGELERERSRGDLSGRGGSRDFDRVREHGGSRDRDRSGDRRDYDSPSDELARSDMARSGRRGRDSDGYNSANRQRGGAPTDGDERWRQEEEEEEEQRRRSRDKVDRISSLKRMDTSMSDSGSAMRDSGGSTRNASFSNLSRLGDADSRALPKSISGTDLALALNSTIREEDEEAVAPEVEEGDNQEPRQEDKSVSLSSTAATKDKADAKARADAAGSPAPSSKARSLRGPAAIFQAPTLEKATDMVKLRLERDRSGANLINPVYRVYTDGSKELLLQAVKVTQSPTTIIHLFDMSRGLPGSTLSKKSGNYVAKIVLGTNRTEQIIVTSDAEHLALGAVIYTQTTFLQQVKSGRQPRKIQAIIPPLDALNQPKGVKLEDPRDYKLLEVIRNGGSSRENYVLTNKAPVFDRGTYRLNFHGRVKLPSVKNFQLVRDIDQDTVILQFGKVSDHSFSLDYREPLTAIQAFAIALTQFTVV